MQQKNLTTIHNHRMKKNIYIYIYSLEGYLDSKRPKSRNSSIKDLLATSHDCNWSSMFTELGWYLKPNSRTTSCDQSDFAFQYIGLERRFQRHFAYFFIWPLLLLVLVVVLCLFFSFLLFFPIYGYVMCAAIYRKIPKWKLNEKEKERELITAY